MTRVYISIGANIEPAANIRRALRLLRAVVPVTAISTFYRTAPEACEGPPFYNGVVAVETTLPPEALKFDVLRRIEAEVGRVREEDKNAPRPIDLDILLYADLVLDSPELTLPDPLISRRAFLAVPLAELAPTLIMHGTGITLQEIAARLANVPLEPLPAFTAELQKDNTDELRTCRSVDHRPAHGDRRGPGA